MLPVRTILCPTDFSERAAAALEFAAALARDYEAKLVIAHVVPPPVQAISEGLVVDLPSGWVEDATARLQTVRPADPNVNVVYLHAIGDAADEIVQMAQDAKADLIVIGSHGRSGLSRLLAGSVAESVLRTAPCPVLTVRSPFPAPPSMSLKAEKQKATAK